HARFGSFGALLAQVPAQVPAEARDQTDRPLETCLLAGHPRRCRPLYRTLPRCAKVTAVKGAKILITGPAGQIAFPLAERLARDNEVWGIARFSDPETREKVEAVGVTTRAVDLADGDFGDLPTDFDHLLHLATFQGGGLDYDQALRVNAEGTGLLLQHCRTARSARVMSLASVYRPVDAPLHVFLETDPLGDANSPHAPTYSMSKISEEAVARTCARLFDLPVVIARMNASYGSNGGLPTYHLDWILAG